MSDKDRHTAIPEDDRIEWTPELRKAHFKTWEKNNRDRSLLVKRAGMAVYRAKKKGDITPSAMCMFCSARNIKLEAAHFDYSHPLAAIWLCIACHRAWDDEQASHFPEAK